MNRFSIRGAIRLIGIGIGIVGTLLSLSILMGSSGPPAGDGFVAGLAIGFGIILGTSSVILFAGGLSIPVQSTEIGGSFFRLSSSQRRLAGASFCILVIGLTGPVLLLTALSDYFAEELILALQVWFAVTAIGILVLLAAVGWRVGEVIIRTVSKSKKRGP